MTVGGTPGSSGTITRCQKYHRDLYTVRIQYLTRSMTHTEREREREKEKERERKRERESERESVCVRAR